MVNTGRGLNIIHNSNNSSSIKKERKACIETLWEKISLVYHVYANTSQPSPHNILYDKSDTVPIRNITGYCLIENT